MHTQHIHNKHTFIQIHMHIPSHMYTYSIRDDYNRLTSDIFQVILLKRPASYTLYLSSAMYGCPIKLRDNMAVDT